MLFFLEAGLAAILKVASNDMSCWGCG